MAQELTFYDLVKRDGGQLDIQPILNLINKNPAERVCVISLENGFLDCEYGEIIKIGNRGLMLTNHDGTINTFVPLASIVAVVDKIGQVIIGEPSQAAINRVEKDRI